MLKIKKASKWIYETSSEIGGSVAAGWAVGATKGTVTLKKPPNGTPIKFHYASAGAGFGAGAKVSVGASGALESMDSVGKVWILESFPGEELETWDLEGGCLFIEASITIPGSGASATAVLLGMDPGKMEAEVGSDIAQLIITASGPDSRYLLDYVDHRGWFESSAKALLLMGGRTLATGAGASVIGSMGYLWTGNRPEEMVPLDLPEEPVPPGPSRITVTARESAPPILLPGDALFCFGSAQIRGGAEFNLHMAGNILTGYRNRRVMITGYTDSIGGRGTNQKLSIKRAEVVRGWLISKKYITAAEVNGYGEEDPIATNKTHAGRAKNRRVEIRIY